MKLTTESNSNADRKSRKFVLKEDKNKVKQLLNLTSFPAIQTSMLMIHLSHRPMS